MRLGLLRLSFSASLWTADRDSAPGIYPIKYNIYEMVKAEKNPENAQAYLSIDE